MEKMRKRKMRERREGTDGGAISGLDLESMMDENGMVNGVFNAEDFGGDEFGMADREERMRHREEMQEMRRRDRRRRELDDDDDEYEFDEERYEESRAMREKHQQELRERLSKMSEEHKNRALDRAEKLRTRAENAGFEEDELQEILSLIQKFTEETVEIEDRRQERRRLMGDRDRDERPDVENVVSEMTELADRNRANMELRHEIDSRVREQERERMRLDSAARRMDMGL
uniref:Uncharacterized protein n=1 Tax=Fibrocapsa japonica TaxID=94617 RepID=A0A7S2V1F6_9STRA